VPPGATSAGAALPGCVATLRPTPVRVDVALRLDGGALLHTVLTPAAVRSLGLAPGTAATALINPQQVLLLAPLPPVPAPASPPASPPATPAATPRPPA
jgi:molybdopterin-binding protein